jgi:hypothetical protein
MSERSLKTATLVADEIRFLGSLGLTRHPLRINGGKRDRFTLGFSALQYVYPSEMRQKIVLRSTTKCYCEISAIPSQYNFQSEIP